jgi:hypothetical protein
MDQISQNLVEMMCLQATPPNVFTLHYAPKSNIKMVDAQTYESNANFTKEHFYIMNNNMVANNYFL